MPRKRTAYQFGITLQHIEPAVWRRILVPASYTLWDLHVAIQDAMGWQDCHLHMFLATNPKTGKTVRYGIPDDDGFEDDDEIFAGWETKMKTVFREIGDAIDYEYDFGDGWRHSVVLEDIHDSDGALPACLAGERACPPEDCGGVGGYDDLLRIFRDPKDPEHQHMLDWLGGMYDPAAFDARSVRFDKPKQRWQQAFGDDVIF